MSTESSTTDPPEPRSGGRFIFYVLALAAMVGAWVILANTWRPEVLVLIPLPTRGQIVDSRGQGIAGARIVEYQVLQDDGRYASYTGGLLKPAVYVDASGKVSAELGTMAVTDADGRFELGRPLRPEFGLYEYYAEADGCSRELILEKTDIDFYIVGRTLVELDPDEDLVLIRLSRLKSSGW